jgi:hypothetical protein
LSKEEENSQERLIIAWTNKIALIGAKEEQVGPTLWVGDSRATKHITCSEIGLFDTQPSCQFIVAIQRGASLHSEGTSLVITKDSSKIQFNTKVPMGSSKLLQRCSLKMRGHSRLQKGKK